MVGQRHPYRQNTATSHRQIEFVVWCLERTIDLCPATNPATEMLCLCIDFGASRTDNKSQPTSLGQAKRVCVLLSFRRRARADPVLATVCTSCKHITASVSDALCAPTFLDSSMASTLCVAQLSLALPIPQWRPDAFLHHLACLPLC